MIKVIAGLVFCSAVIATLALSFGDYALSVSDILRVLLGQEGATAEAVKIVLDFRLPRIVLGLIVGGALAVAGVIAQSVMRNPLADPGILGINSGAAMAAVFVIVFLDGSSRYLLPWLSFFGAVTMTVAIYLLSWRDGASAIRIILIGIGLNALAGGVATFISTLGQPAQLQQAMVWLSGSVYDASWNKVVVTSLWLTLPLMLSWLAAAELDVLTFNDETARTLGQHVDLARAFMLLMCAVTSGAAVAAAGLVGFVGLVAPHIARRMVGYPHARVIPIAALVGGLLVVTSDLIGRTVIAPSQIPVGLITAILGAPFFFFLLWRRHA